MEELVQLVSNLAYWGMAILFSVTYLIARWACSVFEGSWLNPKMPWSVHIYGGLGFALIIMGILAQII